MKRLDEAAYYSDFIEMVAYNLDTGGKYSKKYSGYFFFFIRPGFWGTSLKLQVMISWKPCTRAENVPIARSATQIVPRGLSIYLGI